jgi:endonuclease/exonuclease/phosphatase family metal-dependent hydrolase
VALLVRTWNLFHGNTVPPGRRAFLREMVELVTADAPDVVCLQEVPVWALSRLERWAGMTAVGAVARRPRVGSAALGRWLTEIHHGLLRSALTGEADAILVASRLRVGDPRVVRFRQGHLDRIAHSLELGDGTRVVNVHISAGPERLRELGAELAPYDRVILAGDTNLPGAGVEGFSAPLAGSIDQILVRGLDSTPPCAWPDERRRTDGRLLSDHAPVELTAG